MCDDQRSDLLRAVRVYRWLFTGFGLVVPPLPPSRRGGDVVQLVYGVYVLSLLLMAFSMTYRISTFIGLELGQLVSYPLDSLTKWLSIALSVSLSSVQMVMQLSAAWNRLQSRRFHAGVAELERALETLSALNVERNEGAVCEHKLTQRLLLHVGWWLLLLCTIFPYVTFCLQAQLLPQTVRLLSTLQHMLVELKAVEYSVSVHLLHELLVALHADLWQLRRELVLLQRQQQRPTLQGPPLPLRCYAWRLQAHQQLAARLWRLVRTLECYHSFDLIVLFVYSGFDIVDTINWLFLHVRRGSYHYIYHRAVYMLLLILCLFVPCQHAQACINEYNRLAIALHTLRRSVAGDEILADCLREYSLQLLHLRLRFTCSGFFDVNLKHFGGFLLTVITYVIILIQFKLQD